jgi:acetyltransferase-like isoleucine patch superfamily enzyme
VWIRNYDMHAIHDLRTGMRINRPPVDTILERHVWLGQDALLLGCARIGMGTIIGARSLVKGRVPARVAAVGTPARIIREDVSWGRDSHGMVGAERVALGLRETVPDA